MGLALAGLAIGRPSQVLDRASKTRIVVIGKSVGRRALKKRGGSGCAIDSHHVHYLTSLLLFTQPSNSMICCGGGDIQLFRRRYVSADVMCDTTLLYNIKISTRDHERSVL